MNAEPTSPPFFEETAEDLLRFRATAYLSLGSNLGLRKEHLGQAIRLLGEHEALNVAKCSSIYETKPYGPTEQQAFWNLCLKLEVDQQKLLLNAEPMGQEGDIQKYCAELLIKYCLECELRLGRDRSSHQNLRWGPRCIDIDLIDYECIQCESELLRLPHPDFSKRLFVLVPLAEIADSQLDNLYSLRPKIANLKALPENQDWGYCINERIL